MATYAYTLKVNFTNYKPESTEPTVEGAAATGINIFKQQFKRDNTTAGTSTPMGDDDIFPLIKAMLVCTKQTTEGVTVTTATQDTSIKKIAHTGTDVLSGLGSIGLTANTDGTTYKLNPGFGIVFKVKQGEQEHQYYTYYCYFKEKLSFDNSSDPSENLWSMFITSKDRQPLLFDVQDDRDVIITLVESTKSIKTIDTTNFVLSSEDNGYKTTGYELKNTAFNLSVDDKSEYTAEITPMFCFQFNDA